MTEPAGGPLRGTVAIAVEEGTHLGVSVGAHFGRSPGFLLVGGGSEARWLENPHAENPQGAGPATASLLVRHGVTVVLAGRFGPKAEDALHTGGITAHAIPPGTRAIDALDRLRAGLLEKPS